MSISHKAPQPRRLPKKLTARQVAFCLEYLIDYNGTQAAIRAGYKPKGAHVQASVNLRNPKVQEELARRATPIVKKRELKASEVLDNLMQVAFGDVRELLDDDGKIKNLKTISDVSEPLIAGFKVNGDGVTEVKIESRMKTRELLMKNLGLLKE